METELNIKEIESKSNLMIAEAKTFVIETDDIYAKAMGYVINQLKPMKKFIESEFDPSIKQAHGLWKGLIAKRDKYITPIDEAIEIIDKGAKEFRKKMEILRIAEQRRLQELADKEAARLAKLAEKARARGDEEKAEAFADKSAEAAVIVPIVESKFEKVSGIVIRKVWKAEVIDLMALVKGVASGDVPLEMVEANAVALKKQATATKDTLKFPGVRFYCEDSSL